MECFILIINEVFFCYMYTRMAFKDLLVNCVKTQTRLAVTAMKVSVNVLPHYTVDGSHMLSQVFCALISPRYVCP